MKISCMFLSGLMVVFASMSAHAQTLASYKDRLFSYSGVLESRDSGAYRIIDYDEMRDINGRDQVPERRVKGAYISRSKLTKPRELALSTNADTARFSMVGNLDGARIITLFIHGRGGDRRLGQSDLTFGGNFNRIKNLMLRNKGVYLTVNAGSFAQSDIARVGAVARMHLEAAPDVRLILACGSAGGAVCHALANDTQMIPSMAGIAFLGSYGLDSFVVSAAARAGVPVFIGHGSRDSVFAIDGLDAFYRQLRSAKVPVQMVRFETGGHGTPIRMTDWRAMINWMLTQ